MRSNICNFFRFGHCKLKLNCTKSHDILTCRFGPFCPVIKTCHFRHPPLCVNFLSSKCGFFQNNQFIVSKNCSKFHFPSHLPPPPQAPQIPPLVPLHPPYLPGPVIPTSPVINSRVEYLENLVQKLITENKNMTTKDAEDNSEFQSLENGTTGNVRMDNE